MATLGSDIYQIQEFNEELIKSNIDEDASTLGIGIFGYLEDAFSHIMQNNVIVSSEYINEMFPTRVKYEKSIMDYAMLYNVNEINATPSTMNVMICLLENEVEEVLKTRTDETFIIDRDQAFYFGDYEFHLEYDIELKRSKLQDKTIMYTATYNTNPKNPISKINTPYLVTPYRQTIDGFRYIFINCIIRQVTYLQEYKKIITSNPISNKSLEFEFGEDQLSSFSIKIQQGKEEFNVIPLLDGSSNVGVEGKYCYYRYINSSTIRILFDSDSYIPKLNDEITIFIQSTKGSEGNFEYTEDITTNISSEKYEYDNIPALIKPITNAQYGEDKISIDELKKIIPREAVARGSITSTTDLYNYFNTISTDNNKLTFVKKADNQFERLFYSYLLVKNDSGEIVPTNTIDMDILYHDSTDSEKNDFDSNIENRFIIKPGNHFKYIKNSSGLWSGVRVLPDDPDYLENYSDEKSENDFIYSNPFLIIINTKPLLYVSYYLNIINKSYELLTDSDNINKDSELQFIALSSDWKRGYKENTYKLSFQCTQNINEDRKMIEKDENGEPLIIDGKYKSKVRAILAIGNFNDNQTTTHNCFVEGELVDYSEENGLYAYKFDFEISTEDKINSENKLIISDVYESGSSPINTIRISTVNSRNKVSEGDGEYTLDEENIFDHRAEWNKESNDDIFIVSHTDETEDSSISDWGWSAKVRTSVIGSDNISIKDPGVPISPELKKINVEIVKANSSINLDKAIGEYTYLDSDEDVITWELNIADRIGESELKLYNFKLMYELESENWKFVSETNLDISSATFSDYRDESGEFFKTISVRDLYSKEHETTVEGDYFLFDDNSFRTLWKKYVSSKLEYELTHEKETNIWILSKNDDIELSVLDRNIRKEQSVTVSNTINKDNIYIKEAEGIYLQFNDTNEYIEWRKPNDNSYILKYLKNETDHWILTGPDSESFSSVDVTVNDSKCILVLQVSNENGDNVESACGLYSYYHQDGNNNIWKLDVDNKTYYLTEDSNKKVSMKSITRYDNPTISQTISTQVGATENMKIYILYENESLSDSDTLTSELKTKIVPSSYPITLNDYVVSNVYYVNGDDGGEFFFNYTDIISSKVSVTQKTDSETGKIQQFLHMNSVPMVRSAYLDEDINNSEELIDIIETKRGYIENALSVLEDQFGIDFKFYNTYGPSRTFFIDEDMLDRVDIKLKFEISLKAGADKSNIALIKDDIKKYIENLNNTEYNIHMSNIITEITNKYAMDTLYYIEFSNINGNATYKQYLSRIPSNELTISTPPEFINIHTKYILENGELVNQGMGIDMDIMV